MGAPISQQLDWTGERVAKLKTLFADGLSASQIAAEIGGITRNAVIGKVARLGLSRRRPSSPPRRPLALRPLPQPREQEDAGEKEAPLATPKPRRRTPLTASPVTDIVPARATVTRMANHGNRFDAVEVYEQPIMELPPDDSACAVTLLELHDHHCRWPIERAGAPIMYCGAEKLTEICSSYCGRHSRIAFKPIATRNISEAERERRSELGRHQAASGAWK